MSFENPFGFVILGMGSGLIWALSLHVVFSFIGVSKWFAGRFIGG